MPVAISRILHAGYLFECDGVQIAFDPIFENPFSRNCYAFPAVEFDDSAISELSLSAVFISHYHDDHCSLESLDKLDKKTPIYFFCVHEEIFEMIRALGFTNVYSLKLNHSVRVGGFEVITRRALDHDVDSLFQIRVAGKNILNVVDSWIDDDTLGLLKSQAPWDLILWPFQTMREMEVLSPTRSLPSEGLMPEEWLEQIQVLSPKIIVPSSCQFIQESWSWYNQSFFPISYASFQKQILKLLPEAQVVRMDPSHSFEFLGDVLLSIGSLSWMRSVSDAVVDYDYQPELVPPKTSEVARHFPKLSEDQSRTVMEYCQSGLLAAYAMLEIDEDDYFAQPRCWRLNLYDHEGREESFFYHVHGKQIKRKAGGSNTILAWSTEVPKYKLYAALSTGESLTSMYVRINDQMFTQEIEDELKDIDFVIDPLVRCLFSVAVGSYQQDQLRRILLKRCGQFKDFKQPLSGKIPKKTFS